MYKKKSYVYFFYFWRCIFGIWRDCSVVVALLEDRDFISRTHVAACHHEYTYFICLYLHAVCLYVHISCMWMLIKNRRLTTAEVTVPFILLICFWELNSCSERPASPLNQRATSPVTVYSSHISEVNLYKFHLRIFLTRSPNQKL